MQYRQSIIVDNAVIKISIMWRTEIILVKLHYLYIVSQIHKENLDKLAFDKRNAALVIDSINSHVMWIVQSQRMNRRKRRSTH